MFRGSTARHDYAIMKFQMKRLKRILGVNFHLIDQFTFSQLLGKDFK